MNVNNFPVAATMEKMIGSAMSSRGVVVRSLRMIETSPYSMGQYRRPMMANITPDTLNSFAARLDQASNGNQQFTIAPTTFAGIGENILIPSAAPEALIQIPNGWDTRRFRFIMEVEVGSRIGNKQVEMVIGYTDYNGASRVSGSLDQNMTFYINRTFSVTSYKTRTPMGVQEGYMLGDRSNVIADTNYSGIYSEDRKEFIRPTDVFAHMTCSMITSGVDSQMVFDESRAVLATPQKSAANNVVGSDYLAKVVNGYLKASDQSEMNTDPSTTIDMARQSVQDNVIVDDPFMRAISKLNEFKTRHYFTWKELNQLDPEIDHKTEVLFLSNAELVKEISPGASADWGVADRHTQVATMIGHGVAGLMMDNGITAISFFTTNDQINGAVSSYISSLPSLTGADMTPHARAFVSRFEMEIFRDVTFNNSVPCSIIVEADLVKDIVIRMTYSGEPEQLYIVPAFADSLLTPLITSNRNLSDSIANSMQNLIDTASQVTQQKPINLTDFKNPSMDQFFGGPIQTTNGGLI